MTKLLTANGNRDVAQYVMIAVQKKFEIGVAILGIVKAVPQDQIRDGEYVAIIKILCIE